MKKLSIIFSIALFISCEKEIEPGPLVGQWEFSSPEVEFSFKIIHEHNVYKGIDIQVSHQAIPDGEEIVMVPYKISRDTFEFIRIRSHEDPPMGFSVDLINGRVGDDGMTVEGLRIAMPGEPVITLENQLITRK